MRHIDTSHFSDQNAIFALVEHFGLVSDSQTAEAQREIMDDETAYAVLHRLGFVDASDLTYLRKRMSDLVEELDGERAKLNLFASELDSESDATSDFRVKATRSVGVYKSEDSSAFLATEFIEEDFVEEAPAPEPKPHEKLFDTVCLTLVNYPVPIVVGLVTLISLIVLAFI